MIVFTLFATSASSVFARDARRKEQSHNFLIIPPPPQRENLIFETGNGAFTMFK